MKKNSFWLFGALTAAAMLAGCASQVTEGPTGGAGSTYGAAPDSSQDRVTVEDPAPVYIPQKPGTSTDTNYLQHDTPDQQIYTRPQ